MVSTITQQQQQKTSLNLHVKCQYHCQIINWIFCIFFSIKIVNIFFPVVFYLIRLLYIGTNGWIDGKSHVQTYESNWFEWSVGSSTFDLYLVKINLDLIPQNVDCVPVFFQWIFRMFRVKKKNSNSRSSQKQQKKIITEIWTDWLGIVDFDFRHLIPDSIQDTYFYVYIFFHHLNWKDIDLRSAV